MCVFAYHSSNVVRVDRIRSVITNSTFGLVLNDIYSLHFSCKVANMMVLPSIPTPRNEKRRRILTNVSSGGSSVKVVSANLTWFFLRIPCGGAIISDGNEDDEEEGRRFSWITMPIIGWILLSWYLINEWIGCSSSHQSILQLSIGSFIFCSCHRVPNGRISPFNSSEQSSPLSINIARDKKQLNSHRSRCDFSMSFLILSLSVSRDFTFTANSSFSLNVCHVKTNITYVIVDSEEVLALQYLFSLLFHFILFNSKFRCFNSTLLLLFCVFLLQLFELKYKC